VRRQIARRELGFERAGPQAEQHREAMRRRRLGRDERGDARFGSREAGGGARDIELATAPEIETDAREIERFALEAEIRAGHP
jgi:hypothetical protein